MGVSHLRIKHESAYVHQLVTSILILFMSGQQYELQSVSEFILIHVYH